MVGGVFISYRGEDSQSYGALIYSELSRWFGTERVFLDSESILAGDDFVEVLLGRLRKCDVMLAVIGRRWLSATDDAQKRRIDSAQDWIRRELVEAFVCGIRVIPVLTDGVEIPAEVDIPADIAALSRCQYLRVHHRNARHDLARIVAELIGLYPDLADTARGHPHRGLDPSQMPASPHSAALHGTRPAASGVIGGWPSSATLVSGLPRQTAHFTGRDTELGQVLDALQTTAAEEGSVICTIHGMAGVGKTTLAVHAAHQLAGVFPAGCLFIDLHGYTGDRPAVSAAEALDRLLRRLGVPGDQIPAQVEDRAALFRDRLADRRILVVLDNARDAAQVRLLLPAAGCCGVVITSRDRLTPLDEAQVVSVDVLPDSDAAALFRSVVGAPRLALETSSPAALGRIVGYCGGLPLAIRIAAARHRVHHRQTLAQLGDRLSDQHLRLAELDDGERSVAASFAVSYTDLADGPRRLFAVLAIHPGTDLDRYAAAALAAEPAPEVQRHLDHLLDRHLLSQRAQDRYRFHDLVGSFARQHALPQISGSERAAALRRLVDYYLCVAEQADTTITPHRHRIPLDVTHNPSAMPDLGHYDDALAWLTTELSNLVRVCQAAAEHRLDAPCWQLAYTLRGCFFLTKRWDPWIQTHELALAAAQRLNDHRAEAMTLNNLGLAALEQGHHDTAAIRYQRALSLFRQVGDVHGEHAALANHAWILFYQGRYPDFLQDSWTTYDFYYRRGARRNAAITLRGIALAEIEIGHMADAIQHLHEALNVFGQLDLRLDATMTLNGLGEAYQRSGDRQRAAQCHHRALEFGHKCGSTFERARAHHRLGQLAAENQDHNNARDHWSQALHEYDALGAAQADELRAKLASLDT